MRTWNTPAINELDVRLTASSGVAGSTEQDGGFVNGRFNYAQFNSNIYEHTGSCTIPIKGASQS